MGFQFVPLTLATLMGLRGKEIADATGLYNLFRQVGGSFGIACISTFLDHRTAMHRAYLVERINLYSPVALQQIHEIQAYFQSTGSPLSVARHQALSVVDQTVQAQAAVLGFEDVFRITAVIMICAIPLLLLFKKGKSIR